MTRKQYIFQRMLNISIILIILNLVLFFADVMVLVFTASIDCSSEELLCDISPEYAFFGATMWIFGGLAVASMIVARIMYFLVQRGEQLMDADVYRKTMIQQEQMKYFSKTEVYKNIREGNQIKQRTDEKNQYVVAMTNFFLKIGNFFKRFWNGFTKIFARTSTPKKDIHDGIDDQDAPDVVKADKIKESVTKEEIRILEQTEEKEAKTIDKTAEQSETESAEETIKVIDPHLNKPNQKENQETQKLESKPKKTKFGKFTKTKLIQYIYNNGKLSKNKSSNFLDALLSVIQEELVNRNDVEMEGIGYFTTIEMPKKDAVNPQTQEKIVVPAHHQVRFRFHQEFENKVVETLQEEANEKEDNLEEKHQSKKETASKSTASTSNKKERNTSSNATKKRADKNTNGSATKTSKKPVKKTKKKKRGKITKTKLTNIIYSETELSKNKAKEFLNSFLDVIQEELVNRNEVEMQGIGHFTTIEMPKKDAINPQTKEKIVVPAHYQVRFRFDDDFKNLVESQEDKD